MVWYFIHHLLGELEQRTKGEFLVIWLISVPLLVELIASLVSHCGNTSYFGIIYYFYRSANYIVWWKTQRPSWGKAQVLWNWGSPPKECCGYGRSNVGIKKAARRSDTIVWEEKEEEESKDGRIDFDLHNIISFHLQYKNCMCSIAKLYHIYYSNMIR